MTKFFKAVAILACFIFITLSPLSLTLYPALAGPISPNYELTEYSFGGSGTDKSNSDSYSISGVAGEVEGGQSRSTNYMALEGLTYTILANLPPAPAFTNPSNYYNRLLITLNTGGNPSDTTFAIAISSDNFATETKYVQNDDTVGDTLGSEDWQTYANWGGGSGSYIIGLSPNTTYTVKVAAKQGNYTQTDFGPTAQAATSDVNLVFDIDVASTDTETSPPYTVALGDLNLGSVSTAPDKVWIDLETNALNGGYVYVYDQYGGLKSSNLNYTITSATENLANDSEGYGVQGDSVAQSGGGPLTFISPYNGVGDNVGVLSTSTTQIFGSTYSPITAGRGSFLVKVKASLITPASSDYTDTMTIIASASF
jgi:hypothetical protein